MGFLSLTVGLARLQLAYTLSYTPAVKSVSPLLTLNLFAVYHCHLQKGEDEYCSRHSAGIATDVDLSNLPPPPPLVAAKDI